LFVVLYEKNCRVFGRFVTRGGQKRDQKNRGRCSAAAKKSTHSLVAFLFFWHGAHCAHGAPCPLSDSDMRHAGRAWAPPRTAPTPTHGVRAPARHKRARGHHRAPITPPEEHTCMVCRRTSALNGRRHKAIEGFGCTRD
jgi:hypothetical protein